MIEDEIRKLQKQLQELPSLDQKLKNVLQTMKNKLEPEGKWTPELEERLRKAIELSN